MHPLALPHPLVLDADDVTTDVLDALALTAFVDGTEPVARVRRVEHVRDDVSVAPADAVEVREADLGHRAVVVAAGEGWTLHGTRWRDGELRLTVTAASVAEADRVLDTVAEAVAAEPPRGDGPVAVGFWCQESYGPVRRSRRIAVDPWPSIRRNYSAPVAAAVDRLIVSRPTERGGRLLLLHGPPGTGKTTALRSLAHAWRGWCDLEYVLDPEAILRDPGYLLEVSSPEEDERWRLLVLEDCDELIRVDAKSGSGQALARLLNLTDGILGQGLRALVAITTNEPLAQLHPAIVRSGRCLAQIEVGLLTPAECRRWLGRAELVPGEGMTLADLVAREGDSASIVVDDVGSLATGYL